MNTYITAQWMYSYYGFGDTLCLNAMILFGNDTQVSIDLSDKHE